MNATDLQNATAEDILAWTYRRFGRVALVASFQAAVVSDLTQRTMAACEEYEVQTLLVTGGVAANRELRQRFTAEAGRRNLVVSFPTLALSTDNAAMIAAAAWPRLLAKDFAAPELSADPSLALGAPGPGALVLAP